MSNYSFVHLVVLRVLKESLEGLKLLFNQDFRPQLLGFDDILGKHVPIREKLRTLLKVTLRCDSLSLFVQILVAFHSFEPSDN